MPFVKGDPNINRKGRPKNAEPDLLREALRKEGAKRGIDFWEKVAQFAFTDRNVTIAIVKKFVPDMSHQEVDAFLNVIQMPTVNISDNPVDLNVGKQPGENADDPNGPGTPEDPAETASNNNEV